MMLGNNEKLWKTKFFLWSKFHNTLHHKSFTLPLFRTDNQTDNQTKENQLSFAFSLKITGYEKMDNKSISILLLVLP